MLDKTAGVWPPSYADKYRERARALEWIEKNPKEVPNLLAFYANGLDGCLAFIEDWCDTFDPRNVGKRDKLSTMPFILFERQREFVQFLFELMEADASGLVEKSRDMGATWLCIAVSVWMWRFQKGARIGWGSRKADLVDRIGDMDSIFEKMRFMIRALPEFLLPPGFNPGKDMGYMKTFSQGLDSSITGESGDDIGRGGRTRVYFKDESAHYEHPDSIEASLSENTRVQIDISSVNGANNVFHRKREGGTVWEPGQPIVQNATNVFIMDWRDHPDKTLEWYKAREQKYINDGLLHVFRQETDRNYFASIEGIIIPIEWINSAIDADKKLNLNFDDGGWGAALDIADGGGDKNALAKRKGSKLIGAEIWAERDTGLTARRAIGGLTGCNPVQVQYDCIGVGSGVKSEINRLKDEGDLPKWISFVPWDAGASPLRPDRNVIDGDKETQLNKDFYDNLKAQGWWELRRRFELTHRAITERINIPVEDMICIDGTLPLLQQIRKELSQPTKGLSKRLKLLVNKTPDGTMSPNIADAIMMAFWPANQYMYDSSMSWVG